MPPANTLAEWQLQAVLYKARLTHYYETFISQVSGLMTAGAPETYLQAASSFKFQGGDDIDQIMQCDEQEFLEIMSLLGMASKPLHVRRLQRTLNVTCVL